MFTESYTYCADVLKEKPRAPVQPPPVVGGLSLPSLGPEILIIEEREQGRSCSCQVGKYFHLLFLTVVLHLVETMKAHFAMRAGLTDPAISRWLMCGTLASGLRSDSGPEGLAGPISAPSSRARCLLGPWVLT